MTAPLPAPIRLLETLAGIDGEPRHLADHLDRMAASAAVFGFWWDRDPVEAAVRRAIQGRPGRLRIRLLLSRKGAIEVQAITQPQPPPTLRVGLATGYLHSQHPLLRHKTTHRSHLTRLAAPGVDDTLLFNERGEVTEYTYGNAVADLDGVLITPPLGCGLLPGIERAQALASGRVTEGIIRVNDLSAATRLWHLNSLRGWTAAHLSWGLDVPQ
ncbi:MAG: aminotransferase class IV [Propioniciclava sp.]